MFKGPMQETKSTEFVLVYDPEGDTFALEKLATLSRLSAPRSSRANTINGVALTPNPAISPERPQEHDRSKNNDDIPIISLDSSEATNAVEVTFNDPEDSRPAPVLLTPRLPSASRSHSRLPQEEIESSDDDSDIDISIPVKSQKMEPDDDVSDEDLDDLANELESSLENRPGSSSEEVDSDFPGGQPPLKAPDFNNVPRSSGPISMSRFASRGRRQEEEESSSSSDDDDD